jgi:hypothetical protein
MNKREKIIFLFFLSIFTAITLYQNIPEISEYNYHFGGEYGNIAASIVEGNGYSDPFDFDGKLVHTGPTSWMPPLYTYLLALIFKIFGVKSATSVWVLFILKYLTLAFIPILLFRICADTTSGNWPFLIIPIYLYLIRYSFFPFFLMTHDVWFVMLFITLLLYKYHCYIKDAAQPGVSWGILGGLAFLVNPVMGMVFFVLTLFSYTPITIKRKVLLLFVAFLVSSPWTIRNYLVFERFIPVKSNLFFDLYQSNYLDEDGILDKKTFLNFHPYENRQALDEYKKLGETHYMHAYRVKFLDELQQNPQAYIVKTLNRIMAVFLVFPIFEKVGEIYGITGKIKLVTYSFPLLLVIFLPLQKRFRKKKIIYVAITIFVLYVLPYIFVAFYRRYRVPLAPVFSLLYFYGIISLFTYFPRKKGLSSWKNRLLEWYKVNLDMSDRSI